MIWPDNIYEAGEMAAQAIYGLRGIRYISELMSRNLVKQDAFYAVRNRYDPVRSYVIILDVYCNRL